MRQCLTFQSVEAIKSSFKTYLLQVISHITAASQQKPMNTVLVFRSNLRHFFLFNLWPWVRMSLIMVNWCDSCWWRYQLNMNWWCQFEAMYVAQPCGQVCNQFKWRHLVAKFAIISSGVLCASGNVCYQNDQNNNQNDQMIKIMIKMIKWSK